MEGTHTVGPLAGRAVGRFTIRGRRDSKMERTGDTLDRKLDALNTLLIPQRSPSPQPSPSRGRGSKTAAPGSRPLRSQVPSPP